MKAHDVLCLGEALVDFLPNQRGQRVREVRAWTPCLGGAPANVAVGVARLGGRSGLIGVTGEDEFGHFLKEGLKAEGVDTSFIRQTSEGRTGLGFVSLTKSGERSFTFYRTRAAETFLCREDTERAQRALDEATIVHAGTNSLLQKAARRAVLETLKRAHKRGRIVSIDPNLRLHLWPNRDELKGVISSLIPLCSVVKLSHEEIEFVTGTTNVRAALKVLEGQGVTLPIVTLGEEGAAFRFHGEAFRVRAPRVEVKDTTGAGDGFSAGLLFHLSQRFSSAAELAAADSKTLVEFVSFGCAVGAHVVTKIGAVSGLPSLSRARALRHRRRARGRFEPSSKSS